MAENRQLSPYRRIDREPAGSPLPQMLYEEERLIDPHKWWRIVSRRWRVVLALATLVFSFTAYRTLTSPHLYTATARIRIEPSAPRVVNVGDAAAPIPDLQYYQTEYGVLRSRTLAARVIETLQLYEDPRFVGIEPSGGWLAETSRSFAQAARSAIRWLRPDRRPEATDRSRGREISELASNGVPERARRLVGVYLAGLQVVPEVNSRLVNIHYTMFSPELAAEIAQTHAREFIRMTLEARLGVNADAQRFLEEQLARLRKGVEESEAALNRFWREHRVLAVEGNERENIVLERLNALAADYTRAQVERIAVESQYELVKKRDYESLPSVQSNPLYTQLRTDLNSLESEYAFLRQTYQATYPTMVQLQARIDSVRERLGKQIRRAVAVVESQYAAARAKEEALEKELEEQRQAMLDLKDLSAEYQLLRREADANRELYNSILSRVKETDIVEHLRTTNVSIVDPAEVPRTPSAPQTKRSLVLGLVVGLFLGVAVAYALESTDNTVKTAEDLESLIHVPGLALVPPFDSRPRGAYGSGREGRSFELIRAKRVRRGAPGPVLLSYNVHGGSDQGEPPPRKSATAVSGIDLAELIVVGQPRSVVSEAYRNLRTAILLSSVDRPVQIVQITSAQSGEGKTVTAVNTALVLALSGARVLIVDADLRKPRCHRILQTGKVPGLSDFLTGQASLESCLRHVFVQGLNGFATGAFPGPGTAGNGGGGNGRDPLSGSLEIMPAGTRPPNPAELLGSHRMREMLGMLRQRYDFIVLDSALVLAVTDSQLLATMADGVVLVARARRTPAPLVRDAKARLDLARANVIGSVLNDADPRGGGGYSYYEPYEVSYDRDEG